jgi:hypothetical protein
MAQFVQQVIVGGAKLVQFPLQRARTETELISVRLSEGVAAIEFAAYDLPNLVDQ